jgi:glucose-6-phosphate dehydrogenase assembly protein OpcA
MEDSLMGTVQVEKLLGDLAQVWLDLGKQQEEGGVMRACAMTLIALVDENAGVSDVAGTVADIMQDHPSRAIVVRVDGVSGEIGAHASAFCWKPFGRRQQICCEQIEFRASRERLMDVPSVLRGLTVPNLPVVLWVRSPGLMDTEGFPELAELADKVIVESRGESDWKRLMVQVAALIHSGKAAADLAWTRITRWRELLAQLFENEALAERAGDIRTITVSHSSPEPGPAATYLATWVRLVLGGALEVRYRESPRKVTWQIQEVRLEGPGIDVGLHRAERGLVEVQAGPLKTCAVFRQLREADLLREELSILGPDPTFIKVLRAL